jgi:hypothetical protein
MRDVKLQQLGKFSETSSLEDFYEEESITVLK